MNRQGLIAAIAQEIGNRRLVWFGTRGQDADAVTDVAQFDAAFSIIAPMRNPSVEALALESLTGRRPDLDTFELDDLLRTPAVTELRNTMLRALGRPSVVFTYRPTTFLSAIAFARQQTCEYLGMFSGHQKAFEHKPWVEGLVKSVGVPIIPWRYVPDPEQRDVQQRLLEGPLMLRRSRTTGGVGLIRVDDSQQLRDQWPEEDEAFVSVAPFIDQAIPVNVGAVVWRSGATVHHVSIQLIGIAACTARPFGYCGNDFGAAAMLGADRLERIERYTRQIADLLRGLGYRGAFGVDFLVTESDVLFTEVNPRFQGSTHASCLLSIESGQSCLLTEHLAAFLGLPVPESPRVRELAADAKLAHIVIHHQGEPGRFSTTEILEKVARFPAVVRTDIMAAADAFIEPGGALIRVTVRDQVTDTGQRFVGRWDRAMRSLTAAGGRISA